MNKEDLRFLASFVLGLLVYLRDPPFYTLFALNTAVVTAQPAQRIAFVSCFYPIPINPGQIQFSMKQLLYKNLSMCRCLHHSMGRQACCRIQVGEKL